MKKSLKTALAIIFWLAVWQIASLAVGLTLLLPSPLATAARLAELCVTYEFWAAVGRSMASIMLGFAAAFAAGAATAVLASRTRLVRHLAAPAVRLMTAMPVAGFVILALVWVKSAGLSTFCVFMMCLPVIYNNLLCGLDSADPDLLEMARAFRFTRSTTFFAVRLPALSPHLAAALRVGIGFAWKSGIAGEVIAIPRGTVGASLYASKVILDTTGVLAWTAAIVLLSVALERLVILLSEKIRLASSNRYSTPTACPRGSGEVRFDALSFSYGKNEVLRDFSLSIPSGGTVALMGGSGSGKTTVLKLAGRLVAPTRGQIEAPSGCAFVFQESRLLPQLCALDNVKIVGGQAARQILCELGLSDAMPALPSELSGGMARRVALARALAYEGSSILLLDEPFSGLDDDTRALAADCILRHRRGRTIIIATHDTAEAALLGAHTIHTLEKPADS